jgi:hypothetical protein
LKLFSTVGISLGLTDGTVDGTADGLVLGRGVSGARLGVESGAIGEITGVSGARLDVESGATGEIIGATGARLGVESGAAVVGERTGAALVMGGVLTGGWGFATIGALGAVNTGAFVGAVVVLAALGHAPHVKARHAAARARGRTQPCTQTRPPKRKR